MHPRDARTYLAYFRLSLGVMWLTPRLAAKIFGLDPDAQPSVTFMARLFAIRDVALGAAMLQADGDEAARLVDLGLMVDSADLSAVVMAASRKEIGARTLVLAGLGAGAAVALGILSRED